MAILTVGFNPAIDRILECPDFHIGGHLQAHQLARLASGKAANVSRALAQLGIDSIATGFVGTGEVEFFHEQLLLASPGRILCRFVEVGGKTRENITLLDPHRHTETHIRDRGFAVTSQEIELLERRLDHDLKPGDIIIFSGSLCLGLGADFLPSLIDRCLQRQARVVVDSNGDPLRAAARKVLWILKPNVEEFRQVVGTDLPDEPRALRAAAMPLTDRIENLLISRGGQGALLVTPRQCYSAVPPPGLASIRTVGCGDHLLAGFVAEMSIGRNPAQALAAAVAIATVRAVSPRLDEFDPALPAKLLPDIALQEIA